MQKGKKRGACPEETKRKIREATQRKWAEIRGLGFNTLKEAAQAEGGV
jgi:hypothetical protein